MMNIKPYAVLIGIFVSGCVDSSISFFPVDALDLFPVADPIVINQPLPITDEPPTPDRVVSQCLNIQPTDYVDYTAWGEWLNDDPRFSVGHEFLSVDTSDGEHAIRQRYVPSPQGTEIVVMGTDIPDWTKYKVTQTIMFEEGWDWGGRHEGGKVGFGFGGGTAPSGGVTDPAGFTARLIWRGNRDGTGRLAVYAYSADRETTYGEDFIIENFKPTLGEWFTVTFEVGMNSELTTDDGSTRVWINDDLLLDKQDITWQSEGNDPVVDTLYYSSFYGGNTSEWSPDHITYAQVKNVCWEFVEE